MTRLGMPAADALRAGTLWAAELLGLDGTAGVLEPGAAADIVAVAGDPLQDIECLQQVELVIQGGQVAWDGHRLTWDGSAPATICAARASTTTPASSPAATAAASTSTRPRPRRDARHRPGAALHRGADLRR